MSDLPATSPEVRLGQGAFLALRLADVLAADREPVAPDVFHYQWTATERYVAELVNEGTEAAHLNSIVQSAREAYRLSDPRLMIPALFAYVYYLENELHLEEALDVLETILHVGGPRLEAKDAIAAHLRLGLVYRNLARFEEADAAYDEAERLAERSGDRHAVLLSWVGRAIGLMRRGNLAECQNRLEEILASAREGRDRDVEARAEHVMGNVFEHRGQWDRAAPHLWRAYELFHDAKDRMRALGDLGVTMLKLGAVAEAERALQEVARESRQQDSRLNAIVELMHCASFRRDRLSFERIRATCEASAAEMPPNVLADFYLKAGIGYARFGNYRKAQLLMEEALAVASANRLHEFEFRIERIKAGLGDCEEVAREGLQATAEPVLQTEALQEVSASLALLGA
ncbi:MAG TPA: hypothetical protein VNI61_02125 [Gemmatimonadales bacterium]|nr:hypothetical protein [Gemmatimonadales bacterium]